MFVNMQSALFSLFIAILGFGALAYFFNNRLNELKKPQENESQKLMLQLISDLRRDMQQHQQDAHKNTQSQFKQNSVMVDAINKQLQHVTKNLTHLDETNKRVVGFAEQMQSLEKILKSPKQRGILGEYALETLLSNQLHGNYEMQHKMKNGEIVDAVIFFNQLVIPIDSKFSLEKYNQMVSEEDKERREELSKAFKADVKKRIDETAKYIRPSEGTTEFAFMFIPAEGVYYNLTAYEVGAGSVNTRNLMEYAFEKRVIIVSPSSFFAYLQTVLQGMKALEISENVTQTLKGIEVLGKHVNAYDDYFKKLGKHLGTTVNTYNQASREFKKIDKDIYKLSDGKMGGEIEMDEVDKPALEA